jgi:hypothetical protein
MNYLQKIAIKSRLKKLLPKNCEILKGTVKIDNIKKQVTFIAYSKDLSKQIVSPLEDFTQFQELFISSLKKQLKFDTLDVIILNFDFKENTTETEIYFTLNNKKEFKKFKS